MRGLVDAVRSAQKEKVVRVGLLVLRNLLDDGRLELASDMVDAGLPKVLATRALQVRPAREPTGRAPAADGRAAASACTASSVGGRAQAQQSSARSQGTRRLR